MSASQMAGISCPGLEQAVGNQASIRNVVKHVILLLGSLLLIVGLTGCRASSGAHEARYLANGQRYMAKQDYARAVLQFRNATQDAPDSADAHYYLGTALFSLGDH